MPSFLLTCGLLGVAALGAAFSRGRDREAWLGAALFGFGYLALTFGKSDLFIVAPHLPTEAMINSVLRPGGPPIAAGFPDFTTAGFYRVRDEVIRRKLDEPIPFHFPEETRLEDMLRYIRRTTSDANFPGMPIYVDPIGLYNAERSLNSTVQIDVDAIPVRDGLRLCLKQLGLGFTARSGFIRESPTRTPHRSPFTRIPCRSSKPWLLLAVIASRAGRPSRRPFVSDYGRDGRREGERAP